MSTSITITHATHKVADAINSLSVECFYPGIRRDVQAMTGLPRVMIDAIMDDLVSYVQGGDDRLHAYPIN